MSFGNEKTYWDPSYEIPHGEHGLVTSMMAELNSDPLPPKEQWLGATKIRDVLRSYKSEAEVQNWSCYGIKTTSGICNPKWAGGVSQLFHEEWPEALYFGVIRKPVVTRGQANDNWNAVWVGRKGVVDRGGVFVPFPEAWIDDSVREVVAAIGLTWNDEAYSIFREPAEEKLYIPSNTEEAVYYEKYPLEKSQRDYLMTKSAENLQRLKDQK
jgi:hypothetical protein